jgi:ABC-type transporter Mla maintaining outer membrane lipid asymmetry permease subunit MlaE
MPDALVDQAISIHRHDELIRLPGVTDPFRPPFEVAQIGRQLAEVGSKSVPLVIASGIALGAVMTLHTRDTQVTFGATAEIPTVTPTVQSACRQWEYK